MVFVFKQLIIIKNPTHEIKKNSQYPMCKYYNYLATEYGSGGGQFRLRNNLVLGAQSSDDGRHRRWHRQTMRVFRPNEENIRGGWL